MLFILKKDIFLLNIKYYIERGVFMLTIDTTEFGDYLKLSADDGSSICLIENSQEGTKMASIIAHLHELVDLAKAVSKSTDSNLKNVSTRATEILKSINNLNTNVYSNSLNKKPVMIFDTEKDSLLYNEFTPVEEFISYLELNENEGYIILNIQGDCFVETNDGSLRDMSILNKDLFSKNVFFEVQRRLKETYETMGNLMNEFDLSSDVNLNTFMCNTIDYLIEEYCYEEMSLRDYLISYPLIDSLSTGIYPSNVPSVLEEALFSSHSYIEVVIDGYSFKGMLFLNSDNSLFIYDVFTKEFFLRPIENKEEITSKIAVKFVNRLKR